MRKHLELLCSVSYVVSSRRSAVVFVVHAIHTAETKCRSTFQIRSVKRLLMSKLLLLQKPNADACASAHLRLYHQFAKWRCSCTSSFAYANNLLLVLLFWRPRCPLKVLEVQPHLLASSRSPRGPRGPTLSPGVLAVPSRSSRSNPIFWRLRGSLEVLTPSCGVPAVLLSCRFIHFTKWQFRNMKVPPKDLGSPNQTYFP